MRQDEEEEKEKEKEEEDENTIALSNRTGISSRLFTPKGWHRKAQGNALGFDPRPETAALKGRRQIREPLRDHGLFGPFRDRDLGFLGVPRALPWAFLCHPFGVKSRDAVSVALLVLQIGKLIPACS